MDEPPHKPSAEHGGGALPTTRWSLVIASRGPTNTASRHALDELCRIYWYPLYCYICRQGHSTHDAEDLVQGFFIHLLERDLFEQADPARGRLRGFLLKSLRFFLSDERKRQAALKRGGGIEFVPLDLAGAEARFASEPATTESPEEYYDRQWALLFLQRVVAALGELWKHKGKAELFAALSPCLFAELDGSEAQRLAAKFGISADNLKQNLHRLKVDFRAVFHREVRDTVASDAEVGAEIDALRAALRGRGG